MKCGESLQLSDDALNDLKLYVMRYVYGYVRSSSLDLFRAEKWRCLKKKSQKRLSPDDDCIKQHIWMGRSGTSSLFLFISINIAQ